MKNEIAFIFPGQGAQYVGMGKEEFSDNLRVLWRREFPDLLPFDSEEEYKPLNNIPGFVLDGKKYLYLNADGKYLGSVYKVKNYKSQ